MVISLCSKWEEKRIRYFYRHFEIINGQIFTKHQLKIDRNAHKKVELFQLTISNIFFLIYQQISAIIQYKLASAVRIESQAFQSTIELFQKQLKN